MEKNEKNEKKVYISKKLYGIEYNKRNVNVQLDRELITKLREKISPVTIKDYLENLIKENNQEL